MAAQVSPLPSPSDPGVVQLIPIDRLVESPSNPRKTWGDLDDLAKSIAEMGVMQPALGRPLEDGRVELVYGHRRYRATKLAGKDTLPVMLRELSDEQVLLAQVVENCARQDVHPLEEAEGYERLHTDHGLSVEDIAARVSKSKASVYARMKLLALCADARKALYEGLLNTSTALYVARIPHEGLQREVLAELRDAAEKRDDPYSTREVQDLIAERYLLRLDRAPFDKGNALLVEGAPACKDCPKRTGNQKELFADVKSADVCTDPACWETKRIAASKDEAARLEAHGAVVVVGEPDRAHAYQGITRIQPPKGYARLDAWDGERHAKVGDLAKRLPKRTRAVMFDENGAAVELAKLAELPKRNARKEANDRAEESRARHELRAKEAKARENARKKVLAELRPKLKNPSPELAWRIVLAHARPYQAKGPLAALAKKTGESLRTGVLELLLEEDLSPANDEASALGLACKMLGVDRVALEEAELAKVRPVKTQAKATAKPPTKGSKKTKKG